MHSTTYNSVKYAALLILESESEVTSLDVKNLLRDQDFYAEQAEVSAFLNEVGEDLPLDNTDNRKWRTYTLPEPQTLAITQPQTLAAPMNTLQPDDNNLPHPLDPYSYNTNTTSALTYHKRDGEIVVGVHMVNANWDRYWEVNSVQTPLTIVYFDRDEYSRDDVRSAYAHQYDVKFHDVRARRNS